MSAPLMVVLAVVASSYMRLTAVVAGRPFSVPLLLLVAVVVVLALALGVLAVARLLVRDGLRLRPVMT